MTNEDPVIIVGGGLAGLACARALELADVGPVLLLEASDRVGGRVKTDEFDGFLLDRGFQVYLTDYEVAGRWVDLPALDLYAFDPGARLRIGGAWKVAHDPFRAESLGEVVETARAPIGSLTDKARVAALRLRLAAADRQAPEAEDMRAESRDTLAYLRDQGFSERMIDRFFRAFYGGIFLERELATNSALFRFTYGAFACGFAALPGGGMEAIPRQFAAGLRHTEIRYCARVSALENGGVVMEGGSRIPASAVVVAVESAGASKLLPQLSDSGSKAVTCLYFAAPDAPYPEPMIALSTDPAEGPIHNLCVPSRVAPGYADGPDELVSVTVLGGHDPEAACPAVRMQLAEWFPDAGVERWRFLRGYRIDAALPSQPPGHPVPEPNLPRGVFLAGDHRVHGSIEGAVKSGVEAAGRVTLYHGGGG